MKLYSMYNVSRCRQLMWTRMTTRWFSTVAPLSGTGSRSTQRIDSLHEKRNLFRWRLVLTVLVLSAIYLPGWHNPDVRCKQRKSDLQLWKGHFLHASWPRKYLGVIIWNNIFQITLFTGAFKFLIITLPCLEHRYGGQHMGHRCRSSSGKDEPKQIKDNIRAQSTNAELQKTAINFHVRWWNSPLEQRSQVLVSQLDQKVCIGKWAQRANIVREIMH